MEDYTRRNPIAIPISVNLENGEFTDNDNGKLDKNVAKSSTLIYKCLIYVLLDLLISWGPSLFYVLHKYTLLNASICLQVLVLLGSAGGNPVCILHVTDSTDATLMTKKGSMERRALTSSTALDVALALSPDCTLTDQINHVISIFVALVN